MALDGAYVVIHVKSGFSSYCEAYGSLPEAQLAYEERKATFNSNDDHLRIVDGHGWLIDEAREEDDPNYIA